MATTFPAVLARITSLTVGLGYALAKEPFSFDLQPNGTLDAQCRLEGELDGTEGYLGGDREESWITTVWLAAKCKTDPTSAQRALLVAIDSVTAGIAAAETAGDYCLGEGQAAAVMLPGDDLGYAVARITLPILLERDL